MSKEKIDIWAAFNTLCLFPEIDRIQKIIVRYDLYRRVEHLPGNIVECGVFKGSGLFQWLKFLAICEPNSRKKVIGFDFFTEFKDSLMDFEKPTADAFVAEAEYDGASPEELSDIAKQMGLTEHLELIQGNACETIPEYAEKNRGMRISLLHLDFDAYKPTLVALQSFWPMVVRGGIAVFDEYACEGWGESEAVDEFFADKDVEIKKVPYSSKPTAMILKK